MKKTNIRSLVIGSIVLTAATAGAWFILTDESSKKDAPSPASELSSNVSTDLSPLDNNPENMLKKDDTLSGLQKIDTTRPSEKTQEQSSALPSATEELQPLKNIKKDHETASDKTTAMTESEENTDSATQPVPSPPKTSSTESLPAPVIPEVEENELTNETIRLNSDDTGTEQLPQEEISPNQQTTDHSDRDDLGPSCRNVSPSLTNFFSKLEKKDYISDASTPQPLQKHFNDLATQLLNNPPVVVHETDELYTVLINTAHFFRILGKENMHLLQKIFKQERNEFENIAAEIYRLSITGEECVIGDKKLKVSLPAVYEYAGFFLNTLGGRSYLFRRDPGTRLLVNYYAVLILEQANQRHLNSYGLDIREQLPWLIQEMEANNKLAHREEYLDNLYELAEKYQALP